MQIYQDSIKDKTRKFLQKVYLSIKYRDANRIIRDYREFLISSDDHQSPPKKALLSYLVLPMLPEPEKRDTFNFSNPGIAQYIPRALNELGYSVDIINFDNLNFTPDKRYDLFIGHGGINFEMLAKNLDPSCIKIYFSTGTYWKDWNRVEEQRLTALQKRRNFVLPADRSIQFDEEYANVNSDGIICLGNEHAKMTYEGFPLVKNVNNAVFLDSYSSTYKNFQAARNNFLFFNGGGNVHKGLDLLLEAFIQLEQHLYIRQDILPEFFKVYKKELTEYPNIHLVPFLKKPSKEFFTLMDTCNYIISPTCAEGQPGSVIECMAHGLIPILSREANIDTKEFGITFKENSVKEIVSIVREVAQKPEEWHRQKSLQTLEEIKEYYTPQHFLHSMKDAITEISQKNK